MSSNSPKQRTFYRTEDGQLHEKPAVAVRVFVADDNSQHVHQADCSYANARCKAHKELATILDPVLRSSGMRDSALKAIICNAQEIIAALKPVVRASDTAVRAAAQREGHEAA